MIIHVSGIRVSIAEGEKMLSVRLAGLLSLPEATFSSLKILRRSIDARRHRPPYFVYTVETTVPDNMNLPVATGGDIIIACVPEKKEVGAVSRGEVDGIGPRPGEQGRNKALPRAKVVVVGSGPAGLFAALTLAENGILPVLLERGKTVNQRVTDVQAFWKDGVLDRESNVHFGEGGAGTFSDGKLTSRANHPRTRLVKETLAALGAPADILIDAKPHIGTDHLRQVVVNFRKKLLDLGCEIRFAARVSDIECRGGRVAGIIVNEREEILLDCLVLAIGQNADDTYRMLQVRGVELAAKPFALGLRVEHPQPLINEIQYGPWHRHPALPPAEYFLTVRAAEAKRSVYSFCMCPGGRIIGCSSEPGGVITNGMSLGARDGLFANSAVVVNVMPEDFAGSARDPLQGLVFRRQWEEKAFRLGGGDFKAPAQRLTDYLSGRDGDRLPPSSYLPGVKAAPLGEALPEFAHEALREGLAQFDRKMPGFITDEAVLVGVETRTSAPLRIVRDAGGESVGTRGLFPCGEGAGYAGGIISSALDGIRAAEHIIQYLSR